MEIKLTPDVEAMVQGHLEKGHYPSPDDVMVAAMLALKQQREWSDNLLDQIPNLDALIDEGLEDVANGDWMDGHTFFAQLRAESDQLRQKKSA